MTLSCTEIPVSFTGQALDIGSTNVLISGDGQSSAKTFFKITVISPIYSLAVAILCAPLGVVYHTAAALAERVSAFNIQDGGEKQRRIALTWEHLKASGIDLMVAGVGLCPIVFRLMTGSPLLFIAYALSPLGMIGAFEGWFFSSRVVTIPDAPIELREVNDSLFDSERFEIPEFWGRINLFPKGSAPYNALKVQIWQFWNMNSERLSESDPRIIEETLLRVWKDSINSASFWAKIWTQKPQGIPLTSLFSRSVKALNPSYKFSWESLSLGIRGGASLSLSIGIIAGYLWTASRITLLFKKLALQQSVLAVQGYSLLLSLITVLTLGMVILWLFPYAAENIQAAVKSYKDQHSLTECEFAKQILENAQDEDPELFRQKVEEALYWYAKAAMRGYEPAQETLGFAIFAALSSYPNIQSIDEDYLPFIGEGVRWLQAASMNGSLSARFFLRECFPITNLNQLYQGVRGDSEAEKVRQMFRFENPNILNKARRIFMFNYPQNEGIGERIMFGLVPTRKAIGTIVTSNTPLIPDLADIVAEYCC